jgi:uncharacterized C2H2 Zn-finger protein
MQFQRTVELEVPSHNTYQANFTPLVDFLKQQAAVADTREKWDEIFNSVRGIQDTRCPFCGKIFSKKNNRNTHVKVCKQTGQGKSKMETNSQVQVRLGTGNREEISALHDKKQAAVAATSQAPVHTPPTANQE